MLDQNTDRMWFVIGAVIVGAAIIFIANGSLPTLFASVADTFEDSSNSATSVIDDIAVVGENLIDFDTLTYERYILPESGEISDHERGRYHVVSDFIPATSGNTYVLTSRRGSHHTRFVFFDENKSYISGELLSGARPSASILAPDGTAYVRISTGIEEWSDREEKEEGELSSLILYATN